MFFVLMTLFIRVSLVPEFKATHGTKLSTGGDGFRTEGYVRFFTAADGFSQEVMVSRRQVDFRQELINF